MVGSGSPVGLADYSLYAYLWYPVVVATFWKSFRNTLDISVQAALAFAKRFDPSVAEPRGAVEDNSPERHVIVTRSS
ncbi:hypothetical protein GCM10012279_57180 [Micromonospora yangpuensis]|nr:hypothetical protein GCM10012279_57180 [Micromonospora yangpuensis]